MTRDYINNPKSVEASLIALETFTDDSLRQVASIVLKKSLMAHMEKVKGENLDTLRQKLIVFYFKDTKKSIRNLLAQSIGILANCGFALNGPWSDLLQIISDACKNDDADVKLKGVVLMHNVFLYSCSYYSNDFKTLSEFLYGLLTDDNNTAQFNLVSILKSSQTELEHEL